MTLQIGWLRAVGAFAPALRTLAVGLVGVVAVLIAGGALAGTIGIAIGTAFGSVLLATALHVQTSARWPGRPRVALSAFAPLAILPVLIALRGTPEAWTICAALLVAAGVWRAFVERPGAPAWA